MAPVFELDFSLSPAESDVDVGDELWKSVTVLTLPLSSVTVRNWLAEGVSVGVGGSVAVDALVCIVVDLVLEP